MQWWHLPESQQYYETWWYGDTPPKDGGGHDNWSGPVVWQRSGSYSGSTMLNGTFGRNWRQGFATLAEAQEHALLTWIQESLEVA